MLPFPHQSDRRTFSTISGNSWDLPIHLLRGFEIFSNEFFSGISSSIQGRTRQQALYQIPSPRNRASGPPGPPQTTTLHVSNERDVAPSQSTEDDLFQDFMTAAGSEEEQNGEAPPPYHIATGRIPCKHCRFTAKSQREFIEHFQRRPAHWSCLGCKRRFTTFKDFYRHIVVRRQCNQSGLSASQCF